MNQTQQDMRAFELAQKYLREKTDPRVTSGLREKYLRPEPRPHGLPGIYQRLLESAKNRNMVANVIERGIGEISNLRPACCDFEPARISESYTSPEELLNAVVPYLKLKVKIRVEPLSIWPRFCRTALDAAAFLTRFASAESFYKWADLFDRDGRTRAGLPLIIASEIKGFGFALACDFIKELGYANYAKPDVHIFTGLGLSSSKDPYHVFYDIVRVANHAGPNFTPYAVDKVFWLIGSGNFYEDNFKVRNHKQQFIEYAKRELRKAQG